MKLLVLLFISPLLLNCNSKKDNRKTQVQEPSASSATINRSISYDSCKKLVKLTKQRQKPSWNNSTKSAKEKIFVSAVAETIIPAWIGTTWDFNGTSQNPQQGSIACGYFVTTVLRDAGVDLARIKLAQCASEQMITTLVRSKYISRFSLVNMNEFIRSVNEQGNGLYIVGLDKHTGFLYNDGNDIYFIHASFAGTKKVTSEKAATSWILERSKYKVLGKISADEKVLAGWIN